jgi:AcrR family transcriptional regulator
MARWAPDAQGRLQIAAMELYGEHGYEATTVAEIAERAGLTERTFFRYFEDKREVLFSGGAALQEYLVAHVDAAPPSASPLEAIVDALCSASDDIFEDRRDGARLRQAVIAANSELQERELIKLAALASALADALRRRGVGDPAASIAAEAGVAIFRIAFDDWVRDTVDPTLAGRIRDSVDELRRVTGERGPVARSRA